MTDDILPANLITAQEAQELTGYHPVSLRRLARLKLVKAWKIGRGWFFDRDDLIAHWQKRKR